MILPAGVKFGIGTYTFFSLLTTGIYTIIYENWVNEECVKYNNNDSRNFSDRLLQFLLPEYVIFLFLIFLFIMISTTNESRISNQITQYIAKGTLCVNLVFQTIWLMILVQSFTDDIEPACSQISKVYVFSEIGMTLHLFLVVVSILIILIFFAKFMKQLFHRNHQELN